MFKLISRKEARERGLKHFFNGKPCRAGHIDWRFISSGRCIVCNRDHAAVYNAIRRERRKKVYNRQRHSDAIAAGVKAWHEMKAGKIITREEAIKRGLKSYFLGETCPNCQMVSRRFTGNNYCMECSRRKCKEYRDGEKAQKQGCGPRNTSRPKAPTIPGARLILGRCQSGSQ